MQQNTPAHTPMASIIRRISPKKVSTPAASRYFGSKISRPAAATHRGISAAYSVQHSAACLRRSPTLFAAIRCGALRSPARRDRVIAPPPPTVDQLFIYIQGARIRAARGRKMTPPCDRLRFIATIRARIIGPTRCRFLGPRLRSILSPR